MNLTDSWTTTVTTEGITSKFTIDCKTDFVGVSIDGGSDVTTGISCDGGRFRQFVEVEKCDIDVTFREKQVGRFLIRYCPSRALRPRPENQSVGDCRFRCNHPELSDSLHQRQVIYECGTENSTFKFYANGASFEPSGHLMMVQSCGNQLRHTPQILTQGFVEGMLNVSLDNPDWICFWNDLGPSGGTVDHAHGQLVRNASEQLSLISALRIHKKLEVNFDRSIIDYPVPAICFNMSSIKRIMIMIHQARIAEIPLNVIFLGELEAVVMVPRKNPGKVKRFMRGTPASMEICGMFIVDSEETFETVTEEQLESELIHSTYSVEELESIFN